MNVVRSATPGIDSRIFVRSRSYTWRVPGRWFDIGSKETLEEANVIFAKFVK